MSQYYRQQSPVYSPEQVSEDDYYYDEDDHDYEYEIEEDEDYDESRGDTLIQRALFFFSGGCLVFVCMSCCALLFTGLWILDPGSSFVATPIPGSDIGLSFDEPAFPNESVVNEQKVQLTILDVNRNAATENIPPVEGRELIIVTIELVNLGDAEADYNERDFMLLNRLEEAYIPTPGAGVVDGALERGRLGPDEGVEGRLVFEVIDGEPELVLAWDGGRDAEARYIYLQ